MALSINDTPTAGSSADNGNEGEKIPSASAKSLRAHLNVRHASGRLDHADLDRIHGKPWEMIRVVHSFQSETLPFQGLRASGSLLATTVAARGSFSPSQTRAKGCSFCSALRLEGSVFRAAS